MSPLPEFIQSEQSIVVNGYGAFVVDNIRPQGAKDKMVDVFTGGPVFSRAASSGGMGPTDPRMAFGVAPRADVVGTSMVPAVSSASNSVSTGWELTGNGLEYRRDGAPDHLRPGQPRQRRLCSRPVPPRRRPAVLGGAARLRLQDVGGRALQ
jgi:hypothetical protein